MSEDLSHICQVCGHERVEHVSIGGPAICKACTEIIRIARGGPVPMSVRPLHEFAPGPAAEPEDEPMMTVPARIIVGRPAEHIEHERSVEVLFASDALVALAASHPRTRAGPAYAGDVVELATVSDLWVHENEGEGPRQPVPYNPEPPRVTIREATYSREDWHRFKTAVDRAFDEFDRRWPGIRT